MNMYAAAAAAAAFHAPPIGGGVGAGMIQPMKLPTTQDQMRKELSLPPQHRQSPGRMTDTPGNSSKCDPGSLEDCCLESQNSGSQFTGLIKQIFHLSRSLPPSGEW